MPIQPSYSYYSSGILEDQRAKTPASKKPKFSLLHWLKERVPVLATFWATLYNLVNGNPYGKKLIALCEKIDPLAFGVIGFIFGLYIFMVLLPGLSKKSGTFKILTAFALVLFLISAFVILFYLKKF